jgi:TetR/AcrR family transcriptional repressor of nem operon
MPRPKAFDPDDALTGALELFWSRGYQATSLQDLVDHLGINRRSLYDTYGDKRTLMLAVLDRYRALAIGFLYSPLRRDDAGIDAIIEFLRTIEKLVFAEQGRRGCLMTNLALECAPADDAVSERAGMHLAALESALLRALQTAARRGELRETRGMADRARMLATLVEGIWVMARADGSEATIRGTLRSAIGMVRSW